MEKKTWNKQIFQHDFRQTNTRQIFIECDKAYGYGTEIIFTMSGTDVIIKAKRSRQNGFNVSRSIIEGVLTARH